MSIQVGDKIPNVKLMIMGDKGPQPVSSLELFNNKKVVLFSVPGAFTPTCSNAHLPGFVVKADDIKAKGVDSIICMSVNDVFVMHAWGQSQNAENITMLADGNGDFSDALGLTMDGRGFQMGTRSKRFAMIVNDGSVELINVDETGFEKSSAESILEAL